MKRSKVEKKQTVGLSRSEPLQGQLETKADEERRGLESDKDLVIEKVGRESGRWTVRRVSEGHRVVVGTT